MLITAKDLENYQPPRTAMAVRSADEYAQQVISAFLDPEENKGDLLPWPKTHENIFFRPQEVSCWLGINGHGKSLALGQVCLDFMLQGKKVCIASFEMKPVSTLKRMTRQALGLNAPTEKFITQFHQWAGQDRLWLYDQQGMVDAKELCKVIRFAADIKGVNHFVIDNLMKCLKAEDDYTGTKLFIDELTSIARDHNIHIHLVHHSRKLMDESQMPGKMDSRGSSTIMDSVDNAFSVWRNKKKEQRVARGEHDDSPDCIINMDKHRNGEWEGRIGLWFNPKGLQYLEHAGWSPRYAERIERQCLQSQNSSTNVVPISQMQK